MKINRLLVCLIALFLLIGCHNTDQKPAQVPPTSTPLIKVSPTSISTPIAEKTPTLSSSPAITPAATPTIQWDRQVQLMAVGDIMLGRTIGDLILSDGVEAPFLYTFNVLSSANITVGNLECPISDRGTAEDKPYAFRAPLAAGESLAHAGFDLVSISNNHILDYGVKGLEDTLNILSQHNISTIGAGLDETQAYAPVFIEIDGLRMAFLAFTEIPPAEYDYLAWEAGPDKPGVAWAHDEKIIEGVQAAKLQADIVIVLVHNGYEIVQRVSSRQQEIAHLAIDSGASLVIGSHPHVLQRIETYHEGLIFYSMGNFVFDNFLFPPNYSAILSVEISPNGVESYELIDVVVQLNGVPQIMPYILDD